MRSNLHVFLLLGTPGSLALPPLTATALAQSLCSLEIYQNWSQESLLQVASKRLKGYFKSAVRFTRGWCQPKRKLYFLCLQPHPLASGHMLRMLLFLLSFPYFALRVLAPSKSSVRLQGLGIVLQRAEVLIFRWQPWLVSPQTGGLLTHLC